MCALSKLVYNFNLTYSLASRAYPKAKYSVVCKEFSMGSKFHFSQFIFIDKYLKFKEIAYLIHYIMFEKWPVLFYVNSFYFQQWDLNWDIVFFNLSLVFSTPWKRWYINFRIFFLIGIHSMQGWTATARHGVTGKRSTKKLKHKRTLFRENLQPIGIC